MEKKERRRKEITNPESLKLQDKPCMVIMVKYHNIYLDTPFLD